ncbi:PQQ-binding-like beta-propeller repeat protein [Planctomycetales bacterium ZRK34]|nr:PQQ-binding-like beta-propeller repeat protein [Planctomycetales bacterium ZRK34]
MNNRIGMAVLGMALALGGCTNQQSGKPAKMTQHGGASSKAAMAVKEAPKVITPQGWLNWRGPEQAGVSRETHLPDTWQLGGENDLWSIDLSGRGTPVMVGDRVYAWGYRGKTEALREWLTCLEANTGKTIWEVPFDDFLSDVIYDRYAIGAPTVDPHSGNLFLLTAPRELVSLTPEGKVRWRHSLMEAFGAGTYPNGRVGAPVVDGDIVIVNVISTNWGAEGPPRNRFYAFDKDTGKPMWSATPGVGPPFLKDSSFSTPVMANDAQGRRVFYCGIGSGAVVCVNANTGESIWRMQLAVGGLNSSVVVYGDKVIAIHGVQNLDSTHVGGMVAINRNATGKKTDGGAPTLGKDAIVWKNDLEAFSSSPVLVGNRVYVTVRTGELCCVDADTGKVLWKKKLASDQIHASPLWADGKLYVPMNNGSFYILKPSDEGCEVLSKVQLDGNCLGAPSVWNGKVYVFTTNKLYCFGYKDNHAHLPPPMKHPAMPKPGKVAELRIVPSEVMLQPGESVDFHVTALDQNGLSAGPVTASQWSKWIPPTAKVKAEMDAEFNIHNELVADKDAEPSAGAFRAMATELPAEPADPSKPVVGTGRGRVLAKVPFSENFDEFKLTVDHPGDGVKFAYPPLAWIGARFKWDIREIDGSNVIAKTLDNLILQRASTFIGHPDSTNYTISADVMTAGNRRMSSDVGLINQRYLVTLKGNHGELELTSNYERLHKTVPFAVKPGKWYTLKVRVEAGAEPDSTLIRIKAWLRDEAEPEAWTLEYTHAHGHHQGSPGFFGFAPQNRFAVYIDNINVQPNN